jgi:hypothetical protein
MGEEVDTLSATRQRFNPLVYGQRYGQPLPYGSGRKTVAPRKVEMNEIRFLKLNNNRFITDDEKFTILNTGGSVWLVLKKNDDDNYNSLFIKQPFNRALEAMSALRKAVA